MIALVISFAFIAIGSQHVASGTRCLECTDMPHPQDCTKVTTCTPYEICYVEQFVTSGGLVLYNSGCLSKDRCTASGKRDVYETSKYLAEQRKSREIHSVQKRQDEVSSTDIAVCVECCPDSFCNTQGCGEVAVARANRGPACFVCQDQEDPESCRTLKYCYQGQVCVIRKLNVYTNLWTTDCIGERQCNALVKIEEQQEARLSLIGRRRRDTVEVNKCPRCCTDDFCNDSCRQNLTFTTEATTLAPTRPPPTTTTKPTTTSTKSTTTRTTTTSPTTTPTTTTKPTTSSKPTQTTTKPTTTTKSTTRTTTTKATTTTKPTTTRTTTTKPTTTTPTTTPTTTTIKIVPTTTDPKLIVPTKDSATSTAATTDHNATATTKHHDDDHHTTTAATTKQHTKTDATSAAPKTTAPTKATEKTTTTVRTTTTTHMTTTTDPKVECESDGYEYFAAQQLCLLFHTNMQTNWTNAREYCQSHDGILVVKGNGEDKINDVMHIYDSKHITSQLWVGATSIGSSTIYIWGDGTRETVDPTEGKDLSKEDCVYLVSHNYHQTDPCGTTHGFICERLQSGRNR